MVIFWPTSECLSLVWRGESVTRAALCLSSILTIGGGILKLGYKGKKKHCDGKIRIVYHVNKTISHMTVNKLGRVFSERCLTFSDLSK